MELSEGLLLITTIHLLAAASPGPDFVLVSQQTLLHGKKTGLLCSLGIALGLAVHIVYSSLGLAAIIASSETILWGIKLVGGSYLIYLGIQGLKAKKLERLNNSNSASEDSIARKSPDTVEQLASRRTLAKGFLCNALNPKAPIYFVALFTMVLSPDMPLYQLAIYGVWMMILQFAWFATVVMLLSRPKINNRFQQFGHWLDRVLGGAMLLMGIKVLTSKIN
ncbi:LysE family translocator [Thalassotalea euphylliae]|uniref:LysE family translocator n=1 Tax=Thalassotalea euphylliae TaxID=1655234 RepID=A0A3E0TQP8_9GAMM|nr:LysE family transporter [Thalassotalea euphylliae]REL26818.1 LysE family translocator [Thalassotalea euphylliae]